MRQHSMVCLNDNVAMPTGDGGLLVVRKKKYDENYESKKRQEVCL